MEPSRFHKPFLQNGNNFLSGISKVNEPAAKRDRGLVDEQTPAATSDKGTILVVEDDDNIRTYIVQVLTGSGYRVLAAADGKEGLETFSKQQDAVRLVLLDLTMAGMDGWEVSRRLRELRSDLPVIFMSGYSRPEKPSSGTHVIKDAFLQKPFRPHELIDLVNQQLVEASRQSNT